MMKMIFLVGKFLVLLQACNVLYIIKKFNL